jgi:hypothetical protein
MQEAAGSVDIACRLEAHGAYSDRARGDATDQESPPRHGFHARRDLTCRRAI